MTGEERSYESITKNDLKNLRDLALKEHEDYFERNPHLRDAYHNSLIGICLCQGAASHCLDTSVGIKDFDIWHFYIEDKSVTFPHRGHKKILSGYNDKPIDFLKRVIPRDIHESFSDDPGQIIREYLLQRNTATKKELLKKAVIGLFPDRIFGTVLWKGDK